MDQHFQFSLIAAAGMSALTLSAWKAPRFYRAGVSDPALSGDSADPDGGGRQNLLEYALGGEPHLPVQAPVQAVAGTDGLALQLPERVAASDHHYHLSESPNLDH